MSSYATSQYHFITDAINFISSLWVNIAWACDLNHFNTCEFNPWLQVTSINDLILNTIWLLIAQLVPRLNTSTLFFTLAMCWRSLSTKFNHQINKEKDPNATNTQTYGFIWQNSTSFGVCLFLQGVIRKYGGKAHMSGLHRDINVCANFLSSRRV